MLRAAVFDHDGVLVSVDYAAARSFFEPRLGIPLGDLGRRWVEWFREAPRLADSRVLWRRFWDHVAADLDLPERILEELYPFDYLSVLKAYPDALAALAELHRRGLRVGVLSNTVLTDLAEPIAANGFAPFVDAISGPHDSGVSKPAAAAYQAILTALGVAPAECLFFDDEEANVRGAAALGMHAYLVDRRRPGHALEEGVVCDLSAVIKLMDR